MADRERAQRTRAWLAVGLWIGLIFALGGDAFSADDTRGWLRALIFRFIPLVNHEDLDALQFLARKGMHLAVYFGLGALAFRAFRLQLLAASGLRAAGLALMLAVAVAIADETRQAFSAKRSGAPADVALDATGAATGSLLLLAWTRRRPGQKDA